MTESLWNAGDDYLAGQLLAQLGAGGTYDTLQVQQVHKLAQIEVNDWKTFTLPFQIVMAFQSRSTLAGHDGGNIIKRDVEYFYTIVSVVEGSPTDATRDVKTLVHRTERLLSTLNFGGVTAADGSLFRGRPKGGIMYLSNIELYQRPSSTQGIRYGVGVTAFSLTGLAV